LDAILRAIQSTSRSGDRQSATNCTVSTPLPALASAGQGNFAAIGIGLVDTLLQQHQAGRRVTERLLQHANGAGFESSPLLSGLWQNWK
jgi:hypothetical protein